MTVHGENFLLHDTGVVWPFSVPIANTILGHVERSGNELSKIELDFIWPWRDDVYELWSTYTFYASFQAFMRTSTVEKIIIEECDRGKNYVAAPTVVVNCDVSCGFCGALGGEGFCQGVLCPSFANWEFSANLETVNMGVESVTVTKGGELSAGVPDWMDWESQPENCFYFTFEDAPDNHAEGWEEAYVSDVQWKVHGEDSVSVTRASSWDAGVGAKASATVADGKVTSYTVTSKGPVFDSPPVVEFLGADGDAPQLEAVLDANGLIETINVVDPGDFDWDDTDCYVEITVSYTH